MHTLKGAARSVGQRDVERVCASCEALLSTLTRSQTIPSAAVIALLEEATAAIGGLVAGGAGTPVPGDLLERLDRAVIDPGAVGDAAPAARVAPSGDVVAEPAARHVPAAGGDARPAPEPSAPVAVAAPPVQTAVRPATIRLATDDLDALLRRGEDLL